jgi:replicative DNA helicase
MAYNMISGALHAKKKVLGIEYEMHPTSVLKRLTAINQRIPLNHMTLGRTASGAKLNNIQRSHMAEQMQRTADQFKDYFTIAQNLDMAAIKKMVISEKPDVVMIDYIQLFAEKQPMRSQDATHSHLSRLCNQLKLMASEFNFALIVTSQVNRDNLDNVPTMRQMKDSSGIEQCAAVIVGVFDPYKFTNNEDDLGRYKYAVRKNRHGATWGDDIYINHNYGIISENEIQEGEL